MADSVNEALMDFQVAQAIRWIRLGNREAREAIKILNSVNDELRTILIFSDPADKSFNKQRQRALQKQIDDLLDVMHEKLAEEITKTSSEVAALSAQTEIAAIQREMPVKLDIVTPNLGVLQNAVNLQPFNGAVLGDWVDQLKDNDKARVWRTIQDGIVSGSSTQDIIKNVVGSKSLRYKDGIREVSRRGATALVRTSINHATNVGRQSVWEDNDDIVSMVKWVSTLDTRTTPICRMRDGRVGPVTPDPDFKAPNGQKKLHPPMARPPAHPNCRSTTVAVTKSWEELGFDFEELTPETRASINGYVPADLTYFDWLKRQSSDIQKEALGESRYQLWKKGGVKPERFQNNEGDLLTLDELRKKVPEAFKKTDI